MGLSYLLGSVLGGVLIRAFIIRRMYTIAGISGMVMAASSSLLFAALRKEGDLPTGNSNPDSFVYFSL